MKISIVLLLLAVVASCPHYTHSISPGFKIRLTENGLNYGSSVAEQYLSKMLRNEPIPDVRGDYGSITSIEKRSYTAPSSRMAFIPGSNGLSWRLSGLDLSLHADWNAKYRKGWFHVSVSGSVVASIEDVSLQVTISLGQSGGKPSVSMGRCDASIGDLDLDFHGGTGWILNLVKGFFTSRLRRNAESWACKAARNAINTDANKSLRKLKMDVEMDNRFLLDYSLLSSPTVHSNDMETVHKGEVFWKANKQESPLSPKPIPSLTDHSHHLYLWVTDYIANSATYTAQLHKYLQYNVTKKDFSPQSQTYLDTTCKAGFCVGSVIKAIGQRFPNQSVEIRVVSNKTPTVTFAPSGITVSVDVDAALYAISSGKKTHKLLDLTLDLSVSVNGSVQNERLTGKVGSYTMKVTVTKSMVGTVLNKAITAILTFAADRAIVPSANGLLKQGIAIPLTGAVSFKNLQLTLLDGVALIGTDINYLI